MDSVAPARRLADRAEQFEKLVERDLVERHGLVLSVVDAGTMKPFPPGFFTPEMDRMRHPGCETEDFGAYIAYENTGMCTGAYLAALVWEYRCEKQQNLRNGDSPPQKRGLSPFRRFMGKGVVQSPETSTTLARARRTFAAIARLYDASQEIEPGFFSKFHEGKLSREISTDQCLYAMAGLDAFAEFATPSERDTIRQIIGGITGMWMRRQYKHPYRDRNFDWQWPLNRFPVFLWLAWRHTGERRFQDEFLRLAALPEVRETPPFVPVTKATARQALDAHPEEDRKAGRIHWGAVPESTASGGLSLEPLLAYDAPERDLWLRQLREAYEAGRLCIGEDCLGRGSFYYHVETGRTAEVEKSFYSGGKPNPIWRNKGYVADVKSGHSPAMFARAAVAIDRYHPDLGAAALAQRILIATDLPQMLWKIDYRNQLPADQKWMTRAFCVDSLVNWLWAYWMARAKGLM